MAGEIEAGHHHGLLLVLCSPLLFFFFSFSLTGGTPEQCCGATFEVGVSVGPFSRVEQGYDDGGGVPPSMAETKIQRHPGGSASNVENMLTSSAAPTCFSTRSRVRGRGRGRVSRKEFGGSGSCITDRVLALFNPRSDPGGMLWLRWEVLVQMYRYGHRGGPWIAEIKNPFGLDDLGGFLFSGLRMSCVVADPLAKAK